MFDWLMGDGFGAATPTGAAVVNDQEALGQGIVDQAIYDQSVLDLDAANTRAADTFQAYYEDATVGPAYDPLSDDPYRGVTQETLGRAIVSQAQGQQAIDDSPLAFINQANVGAWASVARQVRGLVSTDRVPQPISGAPRQIFSNRPGQGQGFQIFPSRGGAAVTRTGSAPVPGVLVLGLLAVGVYLASK